MTTTNNGALTNETTYSKCLDYFAIAGNPTDNFDAFIHAFSENPLLAVRILFWSRDCRGGAGARKTFQIALRHLQLTQPTTFSKLLPLIPVYGYWKDVFSLHITPEVASFIHTNLKTDNLCAKYMPRKGDWFNVIRKLEGVDPKTLRKSIVEKTKVVEQLMCSNKWSDIDYSKVPSKASLNYSKIFQKHDPLRYNDYLAKVNKGEAKIHSDVLYPSDIYAKYDRSNKDAIEALWNNLPNYMEGSEERILPLCDVSGSMEGTPLSVSVSLGCYISERALGPFKDKFMTFSARPQICSLSGSITERFKQLNKAEWALNTNLQAAFDAILDFATLFNVPQSQMPTKLLIISDMEFDKAMEGGTNLDYCRKKYERAGYEMPGIVFWNVRGRLGNMPATIMDANTALVSGYSPSLLSSVLSGKILSPFQVMLETVSKYSNVRI